MSINGVELLFSQDRIGDLTSVGETLPGNRVHGKDILGSGIINNQPPERATVLFASNLID